MSEELKPCPYCGEGMPDVINVGKCYTVACGCGMNGPYGDEPAEVIASWNSLPRQIKFTKEKPTKEGYYWCKLLKDNYYERDEDISIPVEIVLESEDKYNKFLVVYFIGEAFFKELSEPFFDNSEWAGPISEPKESKDD